MDITTIPGFIPANTGSLSNISTFGSFGRGAVSMLPGGNAAYSAIAGAVQNEPVAQENKELGNEQQEDTEENPISTLAGKAVGLAAPALLTSGASVPESFGEAALGGAGIGGLYGAGNAATTLENGGTPGQAVGDVATGIGVGALGGIAGQGLSEGISSLGNTTAAQRLQAGNISKAFGLNPRSLTALAKNMGETPEASTIDIFNQIKNIPNVPDNLLNLSTSINDKLEAFQNLKHDAGKTIENVRELAGNATSGASLFPEGQTTIDQLAHAADNYKGVDPAVPNTLKNLASNLSAYQIKGALDFDTLSQFRSQVGKEIQGNISGAPIAYRILSENLDNSLDSLSPYAIDKPAFEAAKKTYATTSKIIPLMQRGAARETTQGGGGLMNILGGAGILTGNPALVIPAVGKMLENQFLPEAGANFALGAGPNILKGITSNAATFGARTVAANATPEQVSPATQNEPNLTSPALSGYKQTFDNINKGVTDPAQIKKNNTVADFLLQQRDSAYAKALAASKNVD
jgi:hypothetical protein